MMRSPRRTVLRTWMVTVGALTLVISRTTAAPSPPADARLRQSVRVTQLGNTLGEYAAALSNATKVEHQVETTFRERRLVALNIRQSLTQVQAALEQTYQLTWAASKEKPSVYSLGESPADRRIRQAAHAAVRGAMREKLLSRHAEMRKLAFQPKDRLRQLAEQGNAKAKALLHPRSTAMAHLLFMLPGNLWQQFWAEGKVQVSVSALPAELQQLAVEAAGDDMAQTALGEEYRVSDLVIPQGQITLQAGGTVDRPTIWGTMRYGLHGMQYNLLYAEGWTRQPPQDRRRNLRKSKTPDHPQFRKKVTLKDHPRTGSIFAGERPERARPLAEYLEQLAEQVDLPILAECDYKPKDANWLLRQWWLAQDIENRPLTETLDLLCADFEYEWRFREGAIVLRPVRWYLDPDERDYLYPKVF